ncbi:UNVERIFIED_CONTAM: hypothetical protein GTU68_056356 [Idotea baltica]|nr:hypothetical protein [Idotea baltica]
MSITLADLFEESSSNKVVSGLTIDSRQVRPGNVFFSLNAEYECSSIYIKEAINRGAIAVVSEENLEAHGLVESSIELILVKELHKKLSVIAGRFYDNPSQSLALIGITGTNGKTTTSQLLAQALEVLGKKCGLIGTLGYGFYNELTPDLNTTHNVDCYVLELSSFQLETTQNLNAAVATCLNISEDHMDRYDNIASYKEAKHRIFSGAQRVVVNRDDSMSFPTETIADVTGFSVTTISNQDTFALFEELGATYLSFAGEKILSTNQLSIKGKHNYSNALAALALGHALGVDISEMLEPLKHFNGLSHRCQWIANSQQVAYYNDSKATNVGATIAAINGLGSISDGLLVLIAGGDAKQADFSGLFNSISKYCRAVVLIGRDAHLLASFLSKNTRVFFEPSLKEAVIRSRAIAEPGDSVLLSPACSSLDMFTNFEERGEQFCSIVKELTYA